MAKQRKKYSALNQEKEKARACVKIAIERGEIVPPSICQVCGKSPKPLRDGRRALRADYYAGYEKEHQLDIRWICIDCDGKQLRKKNILVED